MHPGYIFFLFTYISKLYISYKYVHVPVPHNLKREKQSYATFLILVLQQH